MQVLTKIERRTFVCVCVCVVVNKNAEPKFRRPEEPKEEESFTMTLGGKAHNNICVSVK